MMSARTAVLSLWAASVLGFAARPAFAQPDELHLLTHNVYGLYDITCDQRAAAFGSIVAHANPAYDIVGVQEYYNNSDFDLFSCDSEHLSNAIWCTGRYTNSDNYYRFRPRDDDNFDDDFDGGIGIFSLGSICDFHEQKWTYQETGAVQGVILARVQLPNSTVTLDVYVLHLHAGIDDCDRCCRKQELAELADFIAARSRRSGNPVIVMGDFNIGGPPSCCGNSGYEDVLEALGNPDDIWLKKHACGDEPITHCGDSGEDCSVEDRTCNCCACAGSPAPPVDYCFDGEPYGCASPVCSGSGASSTCAGGECEGSEAGWAGFTFDKSINELTDGQYRIDFIFEVTHPGLSNSAFDLGLINAQVVNWSSLLQPPIDCNDCNEDCNDCQLPDPYMGHVSDHFGVESTIVVTGRPSVWVDSAQPVEGTGTSCDPLTNVTRGVASVPAGDRVLIRAGGYPERLTVRKHVRLEAVAGTVTIGF